MKKVIDALPKKREDAEAALAKAMRDSGDPCPSLPMVYAQPSMNNPVGVLQRMGDMLPKALTDCNCHHVDADVWEWGMLTIVGAYQPTPKFVDLPKLDPNDKRTVGDVVE